jgi:hypothetical protein
MPTLLIPLRLLILALYKHFVDSRAGAGENLFTSDAVLLGVQLYL